ncbi:MAG: flavodoxin family protein [Planctomycetaceae bacterium]|jgi:multimeric flavodoxin WrbA|nr:flavodoxin family protein [Planctomycetaceae bacterium]
MNIFAINGSPRKNWNTAILLNKALEGAASHNNSNTNINTELINLYDLEFKGCISCFYCKRKGGEHGRCAMKDELTPVLEKLNTADAIVFGSPIYFMNITSGMASLLERFLFSNMIYSIEIPTVYPRKIPTGFIYTMNVTENQADNFGIKINLKTYQNVLERILGITPELLFSYNTYQFTDYKKYESSMFSEEEKAEQKVKQFPIDCENAFNMGVKLL